MAHPLTAQRVNELCQRIACTEEEVTPKFMESRLLEDKPKNVLIVMGSVFTAAFDKVRLKAAREDIIELWDQLLPHFRFDHESKGASFLDMCVNADREQWGEHPNMESLLLLGIGLGIVRYCFSARNMWQALPGGMPYVVYNKEWTNPELEEVANEPQGS